MVVGYGADMGQINTRAGSLAIQIRETFKEIEQFQDFLEATPNIDLTNMGYTGDEVTLLKSAFSQLDQLRLIAIGQGTQATANNFLFFSSKLTGVN